MLNGWSIWTPGHAVCGNIEIRRGATGYSGAWGRAPLRSLRDAATGDARACCRDTSTGARAQQPRASLCVTAREGGAGATS